MDNYPPGAANDPRAPWNQREDDTAVAWATEQVTGGDLDLTAETLVEFLCTADETRAPLLVATPALVGPISTGELLKVLLQGKAPEAMVLAAVGELRARYLADDYTKRVIDSETDTAIEYGTSEREALADEAAERRHDEVLERWRDAA